MEEFDPQASFEKDLEQYGQIPATHSEVQGFVAACLTCLHVMPGYSFCEAFPEGDGIPAETEIQMGFDKHLERGKATTVGGVSTLRWIEIPLRVGWDGLNAGTLPWRRLVISQLSMGLRVQ